MLWVEALTVTEGISSSEIQAAWTPQGWYTTLMGRRPRAYRRRRTEPPAAAVPFFAPRSGALPPDGSSELAGIALPAGRGRPDWEGWPRTFWASDENVDEDLSLPSALAAVFPQTGLWPLLWTWSDSPPENIWHGQGDVGRLARVDLTPARRKAWKYMASLGAQFIAPFDERLPPLAPASNAPLVDPFDPHAVMLDPRPEGCRQLLLVPCNRPADALTRIGMFSQLWTTLTLGAIARSWEERFAAVPVALDSIDVVCFAVGRRPSNHDDALLLAAEQHALAPGDDADIATKATALLDDQPRAGGHATRPTLTARRWDLVFEFE